MWRWKWRQNTRERRHYWGQALCCNYDWDWEWDLSTSLKRLFRRLNADDPDDTTPLSSTPEELVTGSSSSACRLEYKNLLEYREINRHARRKIEAWLNDGWSVEWEWNGQYDSYRWVDNRMEFDDQSQAVHQMTLKRSRANLSPSASNKGIALKFPTTPRRCRPRRYGR